MHTVKYHCVYYCCDQWDLYVSDQRQIITRQNKKNNLKA